MAIESSKVKWDESPQIDTTAVAWDKPDAAPEPVGFTGAVARGFKRSLPETKSLLYGAGAALAGAAGADGLRDSALENYQRIQREEVEPLANQQSFKRSLTGDGSFAEWAGDTIGNFGGQALQSAAIGAAGAAAGGAAGAPAGGVGAAPGAVVGGVAGTVGGVVARGAIKKAITESVEKLVADQVKKGIGREAAEAAGRVALQRKLQQAGGAALATAALNTGQEIGIGYTGRATDAAAAGEDLTQGDALRAIGYGIPAGLLDTASEAVLAGRAVKGGNGSQGLVRRVLSGAGKGAATEGATEGAQAVLERAGAARALTGAEAYDDYLENVAAGALGGGVMGGGSSVRRSLDPASPAAQQDSTQASPQRVLPAPGPITVDQFGNAETPDQAYAREQALRNPTNDPSIIDGEFTEVPPAAQLALPPPGGLDSTIDVAPDGTAVPANTAPLQDEATAANVQARTRLGLTPDVNAARARHPAAIPNALPDGTPLPDPANGVLSRVVNQAHLDGTLMESAVQQAEASIQAQAEAQAPAIEKAQKEQAAVQEKAAKEATAAAEKKAADAVKPKSSTMAPAYRDQLKSLLHDSADIGELPDSRTLASTYSLKPREADELRREVIIERRTIANEATRNVAAAAGPDAQGAAATGGVDNGRNDGGAADVPSGPAGQAVDAGAAAPQADAAGAPNAALSYDDDTDVLDTDITPPSGGAFTSQGAADLQASRFKDAKTVPVDGGFVVRVPVGAALEPAKSVAPSQERQVAAGRAQPAAAGKTAQEGARRGDVPVPGSGVQPVGQADQIESGIQPSVQATPADGPPQAKTRVRQGKREYIETAPETIAAYYQPGELVPSYGGGQDRVVSFHPATDGMNWSVKVQAVDKKGNPLPGNDGRIRSHRTLPSMKELVKTLGPAQAPSRANRVIGAKPKAKRKVSKTDKAGKPMDLLRVLAGAGLDREAWRKEGVDPADFTRKVGFNYLYRKRAAHSPDVPVGMTPHDVREFMQENGYLPQDHPNRPAEVDDNDAVDMVFRAINGGEAIYAEDQMDAVAAFAAQEEQANAQYEAEQKAATGFDDWLEGPGEQAYSDQISSLTDRAYLAGATDEQIIDAGWDRAGQEHVDALAQLVEELESGQSQEEDGVRAEGEEPDQRAAERDIGRGAGSRQETAPEAGFKLAAEAVAEPAASSPKPAQSGLFAAPTSKDLVDDAQRRRDAERDGKAGTGRTDMAAGDGELFAGPRPEQARVPEIDPVVSYVVKAFDERTGAGINLLNDAGVGKLMSAIGVDSKGTYSPGQLPGHRGSPHFIATNAINAEPSLLNSARVEIAKIAADRSFVKRYAIKDALDNLSESRPEQVDIDAAAHEAATSTKNDLPHPTDAQKEAGNYKKGHLSINGLNISLENPAGSRRRPEWPPLKNHYGYFKGSIGADKDHVDVFLSDQAADASLPVFVVDQRNRNGRFDEHKVMLGFADEAAARAAYLSNYEKGWTGLKAITPMSLDDFKTWLADPAKTKLEAAAPALELEASGKIEDLGEKIGGARKDTSGGRKAKTKEKPTVPHYSVHQSRTPGKFILRTKTGKLLTEGRYGTTRRFNSETEAQVEADRLNAATDIAKASDATWRKRFAVVDYVGMEGGHKPFALLDTRTNRIVRGVDGDTQAAVEEQIPLVAVSLQHKVSGSSDGTYAIWRNVTDRKRIKVVQKDFPTRDEAMRYMATHAEEIIETKTSFGEEILAKPDTVRRVGAERRQGPVQDKAFIDTFGFRGVEFGNWNNQAERQEVMNHAYDGLLDLADVLGLPPKALSLNGELALAFGARGHGLSGARAHYELQKGVINLTKMSGSGALAHEWFHALDHYMGRLDGRAKPIKTAEDGTKNFGDTDASSMLSHGSSFQSKARAELVASYRALIQSMQTKAEKFVADTQQAQQFAAATQESLAGMLSKLREELSKKLTYGTRNINPASPAQLTEFDTLAAEMLGTPQNFEVRFAEDKGKAKPGRSPYSAPRMSNDLLDKMSALYKKVRGRSGFNAERRGVMDQLRGGASRHAERVKMLESAQRQDVNEKRVPTRYAMDAKAIDQGRASNYWNTPHELAARAFSAYVEDKVQAEGGASFFLSYGSTNDMPEYRLLGVRPFPEGSEREALNQAFDNFFQTVRTEETDQGTVAIFSRADRSLGNHIAALKSGTTTAPMTKAQVTNATIGITSKWGASAPKVVIAENAEGLPEWVKSNAGYRTAEGLYDDASGTVYLVASNIKAGYDSTLKRKVTARERAQMVLVHESIGHYGIEAITGPALWAELESTIDRMRSAGKNADLFAEIDRRYRGANRSIATRETIAVMAEKGIKNSVLDRVIAAMRKFVRGLGFDLRFTDTELRQHIASAARYVKDGTRPREARNASGDEAFASRPDLDMKKQVPVVSVLPGAFGNVEYDTPIVRKRAKRYLQKLRDTGHGFNNDDTGWKIMLSRNSIGELASHGADKLHMLLALPRITKVAVLAKSERNTKAVSDNPAGESVRSYHTFYAPVRLGGEFRIARLVVQESVNGNFAYDLQASGLVESINPEGSARFPVIESGARQSTTGLTSLTIAQLRDAVNATELPGWHWSQGDSAVRMDGRGNLSIERAGETFVQRGEQWYLAGENGRPQDFLTRGAAQIAADRTGGQLEADLNEGARRTWSVILPNGVELSRAALFSQPDATANEGQGLRDRMNARARAALDVVDRVSGSKKEFPAHWDAAQKEAASKFATFAPKEKLSQRFDKLKSRAADTLVQRIFDQFRPLQRLSPEAFMQAHLSKATDGALEASFEHGVPVLKDGAFAIQEKDGGLRGIMAKLNGEHDQFLMWMVGNRAEKLKAEGREQLFTDDDIRAMKRMNEGVMADGTTRKGAYRQAMHDVNRYNKAFLDIAEKAGVVNADARKVWEDEFYIPFYREMEKGPDLGPGQANGLLRQRVIERLVGGNDVMGDPLENMMANWSHMLTASMRNMAANKALDQAVLAAIAKPLEAPTKESVWTMREGKKVDWQVDDKMVLEALESLNFDGYDNPLMRTAGKFKRALTIGVTASPSFRIRNMVRDSLAALGTAEVGYNPIQNMVNGWKSTARDSDTQINLMVGGGAVRFGSFNDGDQAANAKRLIAMGVADNQILDTPDKVKNAFRRLVDGWQEIGDRAETINRAVIYDRAIAAGKTHLQASFEARDLMNFTSMGSSAAVRALAQILPFFNARLQGVDRLARGAKANPQRFAAVAGVLAMASAALFLLNKDDDDYKALPDYVRDTYWPIKLGGKWVYLPKPFEIGALGTIVERATELATAGDDYQARDFGNTLLSVLSSQLAMNPVPQIARPLTEAAFNYDMFRGAPIDSLSQQRLLPEDRFTARTAAPAVAAGQALGVSPQKLEHVLTGYFGWLGIQALNVGDWLSRSALDLPSSPSQDLGKTNNLFVIGDFVKEAGSTSSKYVTRFYDMQRDIDAVYASANQARKAGDTDRTAQLLADPRLRMRPMFRNADNQITKVNQQIRAVTNNPTLSAAEKGKRLENLQAKRNLIAERIDAAARAAGF